MHQVGEKVHSCDGVKHLYLVNKPLQVADMSTDNVRGWEKNEYAGNLLSVVQFLIIRNISAGRETATFHLQIL